MHCKGPLKILHILPTFCKGGGEKLVHDVANIMSKNGHQVTILCVYRNVEQGAVLENTLNSEIKLQYITRKTLNKSLGNTVFSIFKKLNFYLSITLWIMKNRKDLYRNNIINVHMTYGAYIGTLLYLLKGKRFSSLILETNHTDSSSIKGLLSLFFKINRKFRDGIIFELKEEDFIIHQKKCSKIPAVYIPIGTSKPESLSTTSHNAVKNKIVIGQVGRFNIQDRRTDQYIYLFRELYELAGDTIVFYMYGDGSDKAIIKKLIKHEGLEDVVELKGYTDDIAFAFKTIDLYVTINVGANCGVAGLQAIWSNLATVAIQVDDSYRDNALDDVIPNSKDLNLLAKYIITLTTKHNLRLDLIDKQYKNVQENHSIISYCQRTESFYHNLAKSVRL